VKVELPRTRLDVSWKNSLIHRWRVAHPEATAEERRLYSEELSRRWRDMTPDERQVAISGLDLPGPVPQSGHVDGSGLIDNTSDNSSGREWLCGDKRWPVRPEVLEHWFKGPKGGLVEKAVDTRWTFPLNSNGTHQQFVALIVLTAVDCQALPPPPTKTQHVIVNTMRASKSRWRWASLHNRKTRERLLAEDKGAIPDNRQYVRRYSCSERHPGLCLTRDADVYQQVLDFATSLERYFCAESVGRHYAFADEPFEDTHTPNPPSK
jgi:hypothetical protein